MKEKQVEATGPQWDFLTGAERFRAFIGGVGSGKTYAGALEAARQPQGSRGMVIAPTCRMLRDAAFQTFVSLFEDGGIADVNKAEMRVALAGGSEVLFRSADNPDRLRGLNLSWAWLDEAALMDEAVWDIVIGRLRLDPGRAWITTTPRGRDWIWKAFQKERRADYALTRASTRSNPYLPPHYVEALEAKYTARRQKQEMEGAFITEAARALWSWELVEQANEAENYALEELERVVVGVDPAGGGGDEIGVVTCARAADGTAWVLSDDTLRGSPNTWAQAVASACERHSADRVIAEKNYGGAMVESTLRTAAPNLPVKVISASRGKQQRAEPVAALYEQGKVRHAGRFPELEEQMVSWEPGAKGGKSPDRVDALVFALTELMLGNQSASWSDYEGVSVNVN